MASFNSWSAYGSIGKSIRMLFFVTAFLTILFSLAVFVYGAWLDYNLGVYAELLTPTIYVEVFRIMIAVSVIAIANLLISIYGIFKELRCMIYSFSIASVIIFIMLFIGGIMGFVFLYKLKHLIPLELKMTTSLRELYGLEDMTSVTRAWDSLQTTNSGLIKDDSLEFVLLMPFKCCGVNGTDNWNTWVQSKWHMHYNAVPHDTRPQVPKSCCYPDREIQCQSGLLNVNNAVGLIYSKTCYESLRNELLSSVNTAAWLCIVGSVILLVPAFFAAVYARLIKK